MALAGAGLVVVAAGVRVVLSHGHRPPPASPQPAAALPPALPVSPPEPTATQSPEVILAQMRRNIDTTIHAQPRNYDLRIEAAKFYMRAGAHEEAIPHLQAATRLSPRQVLPWLALGDAATLSGHFALAEQAYTRAAAFEPGNPLVIRGRGQLLVRQRRLTEARRLLEAGYRKHPGHSEIGHALGNLLLVLNEPRPAQRVLQAALKTDPERADLHFLLAEAYQRDLHLEMAVRELREAVRVEPRMDEAWGRIGLYLNDLTRYQEARAPLERAIQLDPKVPYYYWSLGDSYALDPSDPGNVQRALDLYREALKQDPNNPKALYSFGMELARHGARPELEEAITVFTRLARIQPRDVNTQYKLYDTCRRLGRQREAEAHLAKFQALFEKKRSKTERTEHAHAFLDTAEAHRKLGQAALAKRDYDLAATEFQLALQRDPAMGAAREGLRAAQARAAGPAPGGR